jgi:DNA-directed RNA polymerase specialized sigma24 family protein
MPDVELSSGWLHNLARAYTRDPGKQDDLAQEGRIAAWRAACKGHRGGNQARAARQRLIDLNSRGQWFGRPPTRGSKSVPDIPVLDLIEERAAPMQDVDTGVDVRNAIKKLPYGWRRIVVLRTYEDLTWDETAAEVGVSRQYLQRQWDEHIAPALRNELRERDETWVAA